MALLHKAIEDSIQKAQVLTTAANVKLGEIQAIDYSWGEIDFVTKPFLHFSTSATVYSIENSGLNEL